MSNHIMIKNARVSFPELWHDQQKGQDQHGSPIIYPKGATLLLSKTENAADIKAINSAMSTCFSLNKKILETMKQLKANGKDPLSVFKGVCLRGPGEDGWREEYPMDALILKANCKKGGKPPLVLLPTGQKATEETDLIYSGCRVNAKVEVWLQDNQFGKRVNCKLIAIQFAKDDEPLDASHIPEDKAMEGFDCLPGGQDSDFEKGQSDVDIDFLGI